MVICYLIEKEMKQLLRTRILPVLFLLLPVVLMNFLPRAANQEVKNLTFCVVDGDHSQLSQRLVEKLSASPYFMLTATAPTYAKALTFVEQGEAQFVVEIPPGFEESLEKGLPGRVCLVANAVNGMKAGLGQSYLLEIVHGYAQELSREKGELDLEKAKAALQPVPRYLFNANLDYKVFMVPGVIAFLLILLVGFLPALNIVLEKESGTIEQLNVTPLRRTDFILAKLIPYWMLGLFEVTFAMLLAYGIYGMVPAGSLWTLYFFSSLFILVVSSLGLLVSNHSETARQAALLMLFFLVVFILTSGLITPIACMPDWAQYLTMLNPLRHFIEALRAVYLRGSGWTDLWPQTIALSSFVLLAGCWAVKSYQKRQ